ncbi:App1 family protein [Mesonia aquimarina]|uniref:App1 family protein n=1 Tax=Mesonia aquimarina TaxID=1504967 RepID=UPI000EF60291|nr:App1 family protein [Mesonia aquimarina]
MKLAIKTYRGYANEREIVVMGHVFRKHAPDVFDLDKRWYKHAWAVIRMFTIKTLGNKEVTFNFNGKKVTTKTLDDGHFRMTIPYEEEIKSGWHKFEVEASVDHENVKAKGEFIKPFAGEYAVISDIDDTFLISHSGNFFKKMYVLLTKNIDKRHVFEEVVEHYRFLNQLNRKKEHESNAFFYVSSSEWNLYNFIIQFTKLHDLPKAVLKLKDIKTGVADFLFTGGGDHNHKFYKIKHLVEFYPELRFILLGDDSQKDAKIYEEICKTFPENISTVYIRQTKSSKKDHIIKRMENIESMDVKTCYFSSSKEAQAHTKKYLV